MSAVGQNIVVYNDGSYDPQDGTSAAAPLVAAILTRINGARLSIGKSTIGFVNPVLYAHREVFNDITSGSQSGCRVHSRVDPTYLDAITPGFVTAAGWDPVTGLGTPNYPELLHPFLNLP
ncbi:MAG: hypothetical protein CYPHOPRED_004177 [Cyphobasidiales sp. Tagirdzhanova-0007]|nr:MAG: hypothetical protein CYPHOPRED_004177 [Cyphobasidiales sp. Tagirdzhanova-0007]